LIGIVLTGANNDGTNGLLMIKKMGGLTIAQLPQEAEYPSMPKSAIEKGVVKLVMKLTEIENFLLTTLIS
jgi:chemotaxis response regulator CheB